MALTEFALIDRYFSGCGARRSDVPLGIGDDGAVLAVPPGKQLVVAVDTLVEGIHFPAGSPAESIGHRALAVNLSDLAAMGAAPAWALLALTLPRAEESWLESFARGFSALARSYGIALVGGDTTSGPLTVTVTALGLVEPGRLLTRSGASAGDAIWVSGAPGEAACGLSLESRQALSEDEQKLRDRFRFPEPRVVLGRSLPGVASACIDVSDGLLADARKLAEASHCGLEIDLERLPISPELARVAGLEGGRRLALTGGDDYELCFAVPADGPDALAGCRCIGLLRAEGGVRVHAGGVTVPFPDGGFDHFAAG